MNSSDKNDLDPQDWEAMRELGHELVDIAIDYHQHIRENKVWQPIPDEVKQYFTNPLPHTGQSQEEIIEEFTKNILPYPTGNIHPRFWGWVHGTGTTFGAFAEFLASVMNPNTGGREHIANYVERQVINWCKEMMDFHATSSGILTSGCTMANLTCLAVARNVKSGIDVRATGIQQVDRIMTVYASDQIHSSIQKSLEVLGMGSHHLRKIGVDENYQIRIDELRTRIAEDRNAGYQPTIVVGSAGTVNTGAIDDLMKLSEVATEEDLWFHIDGAFGALVSLVPEERYRVKGLERADSLAFDMHKWLSIPYEIGVALIQHHQEHRNTFYLRPDYLSQTSRGLASFKDWPTDFGIELSRGFRALKAWMVIKEQGVDKYAQVLKKNMKQAQYLAERVEQEDQLQLLAPVSLNIVCFRFIESSLDETQLTQLNEEIMFRLQESGIAVISHTLLQDRFSLRAAIVNHRSQFIDFDILVDEVLRLGTQILAEGN